MNRLKAFIALMTVIFAADSACAAEEIRTLDANCRYVKSTDGQSLTYREALNLAVQKFSTSSVHNDLKESVSKYIPHAMEVFGNGPISKRGLGDQAPKGFACNGFINTKYAFMDALVNISLPLQPIEGNCPRKTHLADIDCALTLLIHNYRHSKEGDI